MATRIGFYGTGLISQMHAYLLRQSGEPHVIAAFHDPDAARGATFASRWGGDAVGEEELLDRVDAVFVTTWTGEHARLVGRVAERGLALFCEKPLAFDAPTAEAMAAAAAHVTSQVGLILRFSPVFLALKALVADPRAGRVLSLVFRDDQAIPISGRYASTWRGDPAKAGRGTLLEHSVHDVDILQWMLGPVASVSARSREVHQIAGIEDVVAATLAFESGALVQLASVWHDVAERPSLRRLEVFCERLHVVVADETGPLCWRFTGEPEETLEGPALVERARAVAGRELGPAVPLLGGTIFNSAREFLRAVREKRPADPDLAAALPAHRIVDALYASADRQGAPIGLSEPGAPGS